MLRNPLARTLGMIAGYIATFWLVRLVFLTMVTFTFVRQPERMSLQKIGDVVRANQVLTYGFAALLFVITLHLLHPLTRTSFSQVFHWKELKTSFAPNALNGLILALVLIAGSTLGGHMSYLGLYMKFDEVMMAIATALFFGIFLFFIVLVEEFILRVAFEPKLYEHFSLTGVAIVSSLTALLLKSIQYDLDWIAILNLGLFNLTLSIIARTEKTFMASTSFAGAFLVVTHIIFGLPFMGQDMPGLVLLRGANEEGLASLLSGGSSGPESGLVFTVLLIIYLYLPQIRSKKIEV